LTCDACQARLFDYVSTQIGGEDPRARFADVALHLDRCERCAEVYAALFEAETLAIAGALPMPQDPPALDVALLDDPGPTRSAGDVAALVGRAIRRAAGSLVLRLDPDLLRAMGSTLSSPALQPVRSHAHGRRYNQLLQRLEPSPEWPHQLSIWRDNDHPDRVLVSVKLHVPGRAWPDLEGLTVALAFDDGRHTVLTDAWGEAVFEDVPLSALAALEVTLDQAAPA